MEARADVAFWVAQGKLTYACVDVGKTGKWGYPTNASDSARFPNYVNAIERLNGDGSGDALGHRVRTQPLADVVFVDGRFRVAVALKALWHIDAASVVIIHDWTSRVEKYGRILAYYDIVDRIDTMAVLARKDVLDWDGAAADLAKFLKNPAKRLAA